MAQNERWSRQIHARHPEFSPEQAEEFFSAWKYTGQVRVSEDLDAACELCGYPRLRYRFLVAHHVTGEAMWVGSECLLNFDLPEAAVLARQRQARKEKADAARVEVDEASFGAMLARLHPIYQKANRSEQRRIRWVVGKCQQRGGFSPADLGWLYLASVAAGVRLEIDLFPIVLKSRLDRLEIRQLPIGALRWIAPGLTEAQRDLCEKLGVGLDLGG